MRFRGTDLGSVFIEMFSICVVQYKFCFDKQEAKRISSISKLATNVFSDKLLAFVGEQLPTVLCSVLAFLSKIPVMAGVK